MFLVRLTVLFVLAGIFGLVGFAWSDSSGFEDQFFAYSFHLYLSQQGQLVKDRDFEFPFDLIAKKYQAPELSSPVYRGEILSVKDARLSVFEFYPAPGKITVEAPYFSNAQTAVFYNPQGQPLLTLDVAPGGPVCNENGTCQSEYGESRANCPGDCGFIVAPSPSLSPSVRPAPGGRGILGRPLWQLAAAGNAGLLILVFILWRVMKRKKQNDLPPPRI